MRDGQTARLAGRHTDGKTYRQTGKNSRLYIKKVRPDFESLLQGNFKLCLYLRVTHHELDALWVPHICWQIWVQELAYIRILHIWVHVRFGPNMHLVDT